MYPFRSQRLWVNDQDMHVLTAGSGPDTILCLHGLFEDGYFWASVAERLSDRYRIIAPDQKGHGLTISSFEGDWSSTAFARDAMAVCRLLGVERPHCIIGHSWGGVVTQKLAHNDTADSYLMCNTAPYPPEFFDIQKRLPEGPPEPEAQRDALIDLTESYSHKMIRDLAEDTQITGTTLVPFLVNGTASLGNIPRNIAIMRAFNNTEQSDFTTFNFMEANRKVKAPRAMISARRDEIITGKEYMDLARSFDLFDPHWLDTGHIPLANLSFLQTVESLL